MIASLPMKLFLAAISGFTVSLLAMFGPDTERPVGWLLQYGMSGALFAITVLWPYLRHEPDCLYRGIGLIVASICSFWCAVQVAADGAWFDLAFVLASVCGLSIVVIGLRILAPLPGAMSYVPPTLLAAIAGGVVMELATAANAMFATSAAFTCWHMLAAAAIHVGRQRALLFDVTALQQSANR